MSRKLTQEERQMLLDHPQLVMFKPTDAISPYIKHPILLAFVPFIFFAIFVLIIFFVFLDFFTAHEAILTVFLVVSMLFSVILIPVVYITSENRRWKREHSDSYRIPLGRLLPKEIEGVIVTITKNEFKSEYDEQYALLTVDENGEEKVYNYFAFVNRFDLIVGQELLIIKGEGDFFAFVRSSTLTDGLYAGCK